MSHDVAVDQVRQAVTSVLATLVLLLLGLGLFLPVATIDAAGTYHVVESVSTLWQEGIDDGFTDGGGARTVLQAVLLLAVTLAALVAAWTAARMFGGGVGPTGAVVACLAALTLLLGATAMAFNNARLVELAGEWNDASDPTVLPGAGVWWLLGGAVVFAAATLPGSVRRLWCETGNGPSPS